jgi:hypothetical protein
VPTENVRRALGALGHEGDVYESLAQAEGLALYLDLPAPIVGEMLEDLGREGFTDFPEPPREPEGTIEEGVPSEGGPVEGAAAQASPPEAGREGAPGTTDDEEKG